MAAESPFGDLAETIFSIVFFTHVYIHVRPPELVVGCRTCYCLPDLLGWGNTSLCVNSFETSGLRAGYFLHAVFL